MVRNYYKAETYEARKSIGYLLRRGRNLLTAQVEALFNEKASETGINYVQWVILMCLRDGLATTSAEISQYVCYDSGALTRVIDQMEKRKLLKRKRSLIDRRVITLHLTAAGRKTVEALIVLVVDYYNDMLADFSREETDVLITLLTRVVDRLSDSSKVRH